jgi:hypothetical protein
MIIVLEGLASSNDVMAAVGPGDARSARDMIIAVATLGFAVHGGGARAHVRVTQLGFFHG